MVISESTKEGKGRNTSHAYAAVEDRWLFRFEALPSISRDPWILDQGIEMKSAERELVEQRYPALRVLVAPKLCAPSEILGKLMVY